VWAGDESRIMNVGDFASVPPKVPHAYQLHGHYSGFTGPITPGGWDRFFDFCGIPYDGPGYPVDFQPVLPLEQFFAAQEKFAMTYVPDQPWAQASTAPDNTLPGAPQPYFLRAGEGTRHVAGGQLQTVICGAAETGGVAAMVTYELFMGSGLPAHVHEHTHEVLLVLDGQLHVSFAGEEHILTRGDVASIPSGTEHAHASVAHYTKVLASSAPGGLEQLLIRAGTPTDHHMPKPDDPDPDAGALREAVVDADVTFVA
jgi:quercetin 2,3-dioxygenase